MRQEWMAGIRQMGIFVICAQALIHFRPKESYEKYLKLLVSVMILAQLFTPVARLLGREGSLSLEDRIRWYEEQLGEGLFKTDFSYSEIERILAGIAGDVLTGIEGREVQSAQGEALAEWGTQEPEDGRDPGDGRGPEEDQEAGDSQDPGNSQDPGDSQAPGDSREPENGQDQRDGQGAENGHIRVPRIEIEGQEGTAWEQP